MLLLSPKNDIDELKTITGIINSKLMKYLYQNYFATIDVLKNALLALPLPKVNNSDNSGFGYQPLASLVNRMLDLHRQLAAARTPFDRKALERQIAATDTQIDQLVYDLYGLTAEERAIVEAASR